MTIPAGSTVTLRVLLTVGNKAADAEALALDVGSTPESFDRTWASTHQRWQARWASAFDPAAAAAVGAESESDFSGLLPTLNLGSSASAVGLKRVFYMSALSVISLLRTNLPLAAKHVYTTSQGNSEPLRKGGVVIGGAVSYYWVRV